MADFSRGYQQFFAELKRRHVFRVMAVYGIVGFVLLQIVDLAVPALLLPEWTYRLAAFILLLGFPIAIVLAWAFEMTPEGVQKTREAAPGEIDAIVSAPIRNQLPPGLLALAGVLLLFGGGWWLGQKSGTGSELDFGLREVTAAQFERITILPFESLGCGGDNETLVWGLHMNLQSQLGRLSSLRVISAGDATSSQGDREIAESLGVDHIVRGSAQCLGARLRVNVFLIDTETGENLEAPEFDRDLTAKELFHIQSDIARQVAQRIATGISPATLAAVNRESPTDDPAALAAFNRARQAEEALGLEGAEEVLPHLERAVAMDGDFLDAWVVLTRIRSWLVYDGTLPPESAREALRKVESLAPDSPEAIAARAFATWYLEQDFEGALDEFQDARRLTPSNGDVVFGIARLQRTLGRWEESLATYGEAIALDPQNPGLLNDTGFVLRCVGRYGAAGMMYDRAIAVDSGNTRARAGKVWTAFQGDGDLEGARRLAAELQLDPTDYFEAEVSIELALLAGDAERAEQMAGSIRESVRSLQLLAHLGRVAHLAGSDTRAFGDAILARNVSTGVDDGFKEYYSAVAYLLSGDRDRAWTAWDTGLRLARNSGDVFWSIELTQRAAMWHAMFGRPQDALTLLEQVVDVPGSSELSVAELTHDPYWTTLRRDPRFEAIVERRRVFEAAARQAEADQPWLP